MMVPLATVPIDVRKEYALDLLRLGLLDGEEALCVTAWPGDMLVPEFDLPKPTPLRRTHYKDTCADCGKSCWTRGGTPRCFACTNKARREGRDDKGFCANGHPRTPENTYTRPNGWTYCRDCARFYKSRHRRNSAPRYFRVPCSLCGEPACPPKHKKGGLSVPRCRACYMKARRAGQAA